MALYREYVGDALPLDGAVWCQFSLNSGMTQEDLDARVKILPIQGTLLQGSKNVDGQFLYRYNCDERARRCGSIPPQPLVHDLRIVGPKNYRAFQKAGLLAVAGQCDGQARRSPASVTSRVTLRPQPRLLMFPS